MAFGGSEVDWGFAVVINEELERVGSGLVGVGLHNDIVVTYITAYGTAEQKKRWLPKCTTGEIITAIAMTEPGTGSDLANIQTTAILDGDHYVLNGQKTFITHGIQSDLIVVACKTDPKAKEKFIELHEAYDTLSDPQKRKIYDQAGYNPRNVDLSDLIWRYNSARIREFLRQMYANYYRTPYNKPPPEGMYT